MSDKWNYYNDQVTFRLDPHWRPPSSTLDGGDKWNYHSDQVTRRPDPHWAPSRSPHVQEKWNRYPERGTRPSDPYWGGTSSAWASHGWENTAQALQRPSEIGNNQWLHKSPDVAASLAIRKADKKTAGKKARPTCSTSKETVVEAPVAENIKKELAVIKPSESLAPGDSDQGTANTCDSNPGGALEDWEFVEKVEEEVVSSSFRVL